MYSLISTAAFAAAPQPSPALEEQFRALIQAMPPLQEHYGAANEEGLRRKASRDAAYAAIVKEKLERKWFAALVTHDETQPSEIHGRFETWRGMLEFLQRGDAVVEIWALSAAGSEKYRRIPATEWDELRRANREQPHFLTVTYRDASGKAVTHRIEFGFESAQIIWEAHQGYLRHRNLVLAAHEILNAREENGQMSATAQWTALMNARAMGTFEVEQIPVAPGPGDPFFAAVEYAVDANGNYARPLRLLREDQLGLTIAGEGLDSRQVVTIHEGPGVLRQAEAFRTRGVSDQLEPARNTLLGQDEVELRVMNPNESDPRKWAALEFGAPALFKRAGLAKMARLNAQMERRRKELALKKANIGLIAEPIIAGLNIGGGITGVGFPLGEAARIPYNLITPFWISDVPKVDEMREIFALLAAKEFDPALNEKPYEFLTKQDVEKLRAAGRKLSDEEVRLYLSTLDATDIDAMVRLARMGMIDAKITNFLNLLTSVFKVTGVSEQAGIIRDIFNNAYFSVNGDLNLKTMIAAAAGKKIWTPLSGISLEDLANGNGPAEAWAQFFEVSVDVRAVINSVVRWFKPTLAKKELEKPFPYATRLGDLAAYEFRAFGFPLLLFYKRGLIKDDLRAYENDYAYGVIGTKMVVRFETKEDMEREIRANRLFPLGLVKTPDGRGGWKTTNLAVFAYRMPEGRHKGKIALIIYGLKAYYDYSELMNRELERFEQFEKALREGAVIERVVDAQNRGSLASATFEPKIHVGSEAGEKVFAPMLAALLEQRRVDRYSALGLTLTDEDRSRVESLRAANAQTGRDFVAKEGLVEVDKFNSAFIYRREREGKWELVKMSSLASIDEIKRELAKADETRLLAERRRKVATGEEGGLVTIHTVRDVNGVKEVGPLLPPDQRPNWLKASGDGNEAVNRVFQLLEELSPVERARLAYNKYAATLVDLDLRGVGRKQNYFLTIEFPPGRVTRISTNLATGKAERKVFENGRTLEVATAQSVVEFSYAENGAERETKTYWNTGTVEAPQKGALLESTRTIEVWRRDLNESSTDPYAPLISKLKLNHFTGESRVENYGLFPLPVQIVDEQFITTQKFDDKGRFAEATTVENGLTEQDFQRTASEKLAKPIPGATLYRSRPKTNRATTEGQSGVVREDVTRGLIRTVIVDDARSGRPILESFVDEHEFLVEYSYDNDWWLGMIPEKAVVRRADSGKVLRQIEYIEFSPETRRLKGIETDYRGLVSTQVWDRRWTAPIETETALRKTTVSFDRRGMTGQGKTIDKQSGEVVRDFVVTWNPAERSWQSVDQWWHAPGVPLRKETNWLSGFGRLIRSDVGGVFRMIPGYDSNGHEVDRRVLRRNPQTSAYDILSHIGDDFRWDNGRRDARRRVWVDGELYEESRCLMDEEGRMLTSDTRTISGINLSTQMSYDRGTERRSRTVSLQNGQARKTEEYAPAYQTNGVWILPGKATPAWGLIATNLYVLGDPYGRADGTIFEDGSQVRTIEWFNETAIPKISERRNRHGRVNQRWQIRLRAGTEGAFTYDLAEGSEISPWGDAGLSQTRAVISGTDMALFKDAAGERIYFDTTKLFESPLYARRLSSSVGVTIPYGGTNVDKVARIFRVTPNAAAQQLVIEGVDLLGFFSMGFSRQVFDRAGNLLEERTGVLPRSPQSILNPASLLQAMNTQPPLRQFNYRYESGSWAPGKDSLSGVEVWSFTNSASANPVNAGSVEMATRVDEFMLARGTNQPASVSHRRNLKQNPWLPHITDHWAEWKTTEGMGSGAPFETTVLYNAQGLPVVTRSQKFTADSKPAEKISIDIPPPARAQWTETNLLGWRTTINLPVTFSDARGAYFIYLFLNAVEARPELIVEDAKGTEVIVSLGDTAGQKNTASFWPADSGHVLWSPNVDNPREGVALSSSISSQPNERLWAAPVAGLKKAGLDVSSIRKISLRVMGRGRPTLKFTAPSLIMRVAREGEFTPKLEETFQEFAFSSGLRSVTARSPRGGWKTSLLWNGNPIVSGLQREALQSPRLTFSDHADPQSPRPLYTLNADDNSFLESYRMFESAGETRVYSLVSGIESPRLEIFRADRLADELRPSLLAYGRDLPVVIEPRVGGGVLESLQLRVQASAWRQVGSRLFGLDDETSEARQQLSRLNADVSNARDTGQGLRLADAAMAFRDLPWRGYASTQSVVRVPTNALVLKLQQLALQFPTRLIATSPGSEAEQFVETTREAELVSLAISMNAGSLAGEILDFYWDHSSGGEDLLFDWYDAETGASVFKSPNFARPMDAERSAHSQIAVAEAAFRLAAAYGDTNAFRFGRTLLQTFLDNYRVEQREGLFGICEQIKMEEKKALGLPMLAPPRRFSAGTNAKFYLLLRRLDAWIAQTRPFNDDADLRVLVRTSLTEQEQWLRANFEISQSGVHSLARGVYEVQDAGSGRSEFRPELSTSSEDWLAVIESFDLLGASKAASRERLENLSRAHGAYIGSAWGLDWTVPWRRAEAISPRLTAQFHRVANQIGYPEATRFSGDQLSRMIKPRGDIDGAISGSFPSGPLITGSDETLFPNPNTGRWPSDMAAFSALLDQRWLTNLPSAAPMRAAPAATRDISGFFLTAGFLYLAILLITFFWWLLNWWRKKQNPLRIESVASAVVRQKAEERWAKRVLGVKTPDGADRTRFSNSAVEGNFHMQLRAIYKIVVEWRRVENGWEENDPRLVEDGADPWLNGMDEFAAMVSMYSRYVVKAGRKDGLPKADPFEENEDSNHIWSRLVLYFSEYLWGALQLLKQFKENPQAARIFGINDQIEAVLRTMGARQRRESFDARVLFDFPANPNAMDLLAIQLPGASLNSISELIEQRLRIPRSQFRSFLKNYKTFKYREQVYPVHPYIIEASKLFPHFILMGLVSVIWYNQDVNGLLIFPYLKQLALNILQSKNSLWWAVPLLLGTAFAVAAGYVHSYRYTGTIRARKRQKQQLLTKEVISSSSQQSALPSIRPGWQWDPVWYERLGWILRGLGMVGLAVYLMALPAPSLATFTLIKGLFVPILLAEAAAILLPLLASFFSAWLEDRVASGKDKSTFGRFVNSLNLTPTRPASILWLGVKYHFQSSVPSGGLWSMTRCVLFYFIFTAMFFFIGSYSFKEVLRVWFAQRFHQGWDWELAIGSVLFWNTMYLLRFGLFVFVVGTASFVVTFPLQALALGMSLLYFITALAAPAYLPPPTISYGLAVLFAAIALAAPWLKERFARLPSLKRWRARHEKREQEGIADLKTGNRTLAIVYMSGDDLCCLKLTAEVLLARLQVLRDKLGSEGATVLLESMGVTDETALTKDWARLYALEKKHAVSLWHPMQLLVPGETPRLDEKLGLNLIADSDEDREALLKAWQIRRWLVTMMSTAGHAQDTAINLVDIALRLKEEGLSQSIAFYLIQNKYDNNDNNRPSQVSYTTGELAQRNKLAHLLMHVAPGSRAYNINDWTPFGFKAGGLVGMDFIHEESLNLSNMCVLDRNANTHDLTALMADLKGALADPGVIIVVPGRSTTNALTPLGQASQLVEEGHRAMIKGLMAIGGGAGESVGTGWGNIQAIYYGRVQEALLDPDSPKMPLTSRMRQGTSFRERSHGMIGFGPHAVGISEDIWGVTQAAHNAIALGKTVKFRESKAFWHKIRETWSHAEWFSAFPRWSGGYLQMMLDPIMQKINDGGPLSVFAKEIRANCGRYFLSAPFALLNILLMPLAIIWDVSPFVQVLVVLWLFGLVMNQVLTMLGAVAYLEAGGFSRLSGIVGGAALGAACYLNPNWQLLTPAAILLGCITGGFAIGLGKWLFNRGRDLIVFGPQLVIHALGQVVRQSLEFVLSGASADDAKGVNIAFRGWVGPREDRPWERYANFINLRTVIWGVGLLSLVLNIFALAKLDFLNALLLLPSLFFSISTLIGPFLMAPKPGDRAGAKSLLAKVAGWLAGSAYFILVAFLLTRSGWPVWLGIALFFGAILAVCHSGLRYFGYSRKLRKREEELAKLLESAAVSDHRKLAQQAVRVYQGDPAKLKDTLDKAKIENTAQEKILAFSEKVLRPLIRKPVLDVHGPKTTSASSRWTAEFRRSFALSILTLIWFLFVPVPGLLVFSGLGYRFSLPLPALINAVIALIVFTLAAATISRLLEKVSLNKIRPRLKDVTTRLQNLAAKKGSLSDGEISTLYGLSMDAVTFTDQRGYAYANQKLNEADAILRQVESKTGRTSSASP